MDRVTLGRIFKRLEIQKLLAIDQVQEFKGSALGIGLVRFQNRMICIK